MALRCHHCHQKLPEFKKHLFNLPVCTQIHRVVAVATSQGTFQQKWSNSGFTFSSLTQLVACRSEIRFSAHWIITLPPEPLMLHCTNVYDKRLNIDLIIMDLDFFMVFIYWSFEITQVSFYMWQWDLLLCFSHFCFFLNHWKIGNILIF